MNFTPIALVVQSVGVTKIGNNLLTIFSNIRGFFKIATSYSHLNDCSPFHHVYANLKILRNCRRLVKGYCLGKVSQP